jgi:hypothetical protein
MEKEIKKGRKYVQERGGETEKEGGRERKERKRE